MVRMLANQSVAFALSLLLGVALAVSVASLLPLALAAGWGLLAGAAGNYAVVWRLHPAAVRERGRARYRQWRLERALLFGKEWW